MSARNEMDVVVTLAAPGLLDPDTLENHMFQVLEAVEQHGPSAVLGPVVSADLSESTIELAFSVESATLSAAQAIVAKVLKVIEKNTDVRFSGAGTSAREPDEAHDFALSA